MVEATLCEVCKRVAELGMPCHPISCQCRCHWNTKRAHAAMLKKKGMSVDSINDRIGKAVKKGYGIY